jgi:hypothetical protein
MRQIAKLRFTCTVTARIGFCLALDLNLEAHLNDLRSGEAEIDCRAIGV